MEKLIYNKKKKNTSYLTYYDEILGPAFISQCIPLNSLSNTNLNIIDNVDHINNLNIIDNIDDVHIIDNITDVHIIDNIDDVHIINNINDVHIIDNIDDVHIIDNIDNIHIINNVNDVNIIDDVIDNINDIDYMINNNIKNIDNIEKIENNNNKQYIKYNIYNMCEQMEKIDLENNLVINNNCNNDCTNDCKNNEEKQVLNNTISLPDLTFNDILTNLKILAIVTENNKLTCFQNKLNIDKYWLSSLRRWLWGQNGDVTVKFIIHLIKCTDDYCKQIREADDTYVDFINQNKLNDLTIAINNSIYGLENLKNTYKYHSDNSIYVRLDTCINEIKRIAEVNMKFT